VADRARRLAEPIGHLPRDRHESLAGRMREAELDLRDWPGRAFRFRPGPATHQRVLRARRGASERTEFAYGPTLLCNRQHLGVGVGTSPSGSQPGSIAEEQEGDEDAGRDEHARGDERAQVERWHRARRQVLALESFVLDRLPGAARRRPRASGSENQSSSGLSSILHANVAPRGLHGRSDQSRPQARPSPARGRRPSA
jgi:hypothetical protein